MFKMSRREFVKGLGFFAGFVALGKVSAPIIDEAVQTISIDKMQSDGYTNEEIAKMCLELNPYITDKEKSRIKKTLSALNAFSFAYFKESLNKIEKLKFEYIQTEKYGDNYKRAYADNDKIVCYKSKDEYDEKAIESAIYTTYHAEYAYRKVVDELLDEGICKYDIAALFLEKNTNLNAKEKKALKPICDFLNDYVTGDKFIDAVTTLRLLNISYSNNKDKSVVGLYPSKYMIYIFDGGDDHTILHEAFHAIHDAKYRTFLEEGMSELLADEYMPNVESNAYPTSVSDVKSLCELLDTSTVVQAYLDNNSSAMHNKISDELLKLDDDKEMLAEFYILLEKRLSGDIIYREDALRLREIYDIYYQKKYGYSISQNYVVNSYLDNQSAYVISKTYYNSENKKNDKILYLIDGSQRKLRG